MAPPNDHGAISMLLALVGPHKGKRGEVDLYPKTGGQGTTLSAPRMRPPRWADSDRPYTPTVQREKT